MPSPSRPVSTIKTSERSYASGTPVLQGDYPRVSNGLIAPSYHQNPSLQSLSSTSPSFSNFGFTSSSTLKKEKQGPTKKHTETPIPKILTQTNKAPQNSIRK